MSRPEDSSSLSPHGKVRTSYDATKVSQLDFDINFFASVLSRSPNYIDVLRCQGELLTRKGQHADALEVDRRLVSLLPRDPVVHYNLACSLAQVGQRRESINSLRTALDYGYDDIEFLLTDCDLASLRDEPAFQALLAEFTDVEPA